MQLVLVMFRAEGERRSFSITKDVTVIGRREDCDLRIPVSEVSRKHCRVIKDGDDVRVEDLGSSNGTFHNGQRIQGSVVVQPGDSIEVGPVVFVVQVDGVPQDDELVPFTDRAAHDLEGSEAGAAAVGAAAGMDDLDDFGGADANTAGENLDAYLEQQGVGTADAAGNSASGELDAIPLEEAPAGAESAHAGSDDLQLDEPAIETTEHHDNHHAPIPMHLDAEDSAAGGVPLVAPGEAASDEPTLDIDLNDDHGGAHHALSEDELLLDLNTHDDKEKH